MKTTQVLAVLCIMAIAMAPVLGASSGTASSASSSGLVTTAHSDSWGVSADTKSTAGTDSASFLGADAASSGASAFDLGVDGSAASTSGGAIGVVAVTDSKAYAEGDTATAKADSHATGLIAATGGSSGSTVFPATANADANGLAIVGITTSDASSAGASP